MTPVLAITIVLVTILIWMHITKSAKNGNNYIAAFLYLILIICVVGLIIFQFTDWLLGNKIQTDLRNLILLICVPFAFFIVMLYNVWKRKIRNCILIPNNYSKKYVLIVFNQRNKQIIKANYGISRKRILKFEDNGILLVQNSRSNLRSTRDLTEIRYQNRKKYSENDRKEIYIEKYDFSGYECDLLVFNVDSKIYSDSVISTFPTMEDIKDFIKDKEDNR